MPERKLTASLEDYIEVIYNHIEQKNSVKAIEISKELNVSRASVSEALKKLEKEGLINYGHYGNISITEIGSKKAKEITIKHKTLETFFKEILKLDDAEASENACRIEHVITTKAFKKMEKFVSFCKKNNIFQNFDEYIKK